MKIFLKKNSESVPSHLTRFIMPSRSHSVRLCPKRIPSSSQPCTLSSDFCPRDGTRKCITISRSSGCFFQKSIASFSSSVRTTSRLGLPSLSLYRAARKNPAGFAFIASRSSFSLRRSFLRQCIIMHTISS